MDEQGCQGLGSARLKDSVCGDCSGVAAIEYAFLASLIAIALVGALALLGVNVTSLWGDVDTAVEGTSYETGSN